MGNAVVIIVVYVLKGAGSVILKLLIALLFLFALGLIDPGRQAR
ncbi:MAG: hypothetical protein ACOY30_15830 [Bacillota bacterium]